MSRILVIRLGALGDFIQSFAPFAAIRAHHAGAHVTLLTTAPFAPLAASSPWFDAIALDPRPAWWQIGGILALRRRLRGFDLVYDLQTSARSSRYFRLAGRPRWSGIAPGCALPHANPRRDFMHTGERQREQLAMAGIHEFPPPDLAWLSAGVTPVPLPSRYAVLVPGAAPHRPEKRWPAERFGELAALLAVRGMTPVVIGSGQEGPLASAIRARARRDRPCRADHAMRARPHPRRRGDRDRQRYRADASRNPSRPPGDRAVFGRERPRDHRAALSRWRLAGNFHERRSRRSAAGEGCRGTSLTP